LRQISENFAGLAMNESKKLDGRPRFRIQPYPGDGCGEPKDMSSIGSMSDHGRRTGRRCW
jgi:hypothetical protein